MKSVVLRRVAAFLLVTCVVFQCGKTKKASQPHSELGAVRVHMVDLNPPATRGLAASYSFSVVLYQYGSGSHPGGWPDDRVASRFSFTESMFVLDSLDPDLYDLEVTISGDVDDNGIDEPIWVPTLVTKLRIGRDSISFVDVPPSGQPHVEDTGEWPIAPFSLEWGGRIEPR